MAIELNGMTSSEPKKDDKTETGETDRLPSRRGFLNRLWIALGGLALVEVAWLVFAFLKPRKPVSRPGGFGGIIDCGLVDDFPPGTVTAFQRGHFYLSRMDDGGFLALSRKCTHLGCTVIWDSGKNLFECPCHASAFSPTGEVISKPAPRALDCHAITIENNFVRVDTGRRFKRQHFSPEQVTKA